MWYIHLWCIVIATLSDACINQSIKANWSVSPIAYQVHMEWRFQSHSHTPWVMLATASQCFWFTWNMLSKRITSHAFITCSGQFKVRYTYRNSRNTTNSMIKAQVQNQVMTSCTLTVAFVIVICILTNRIITPCKGVSGAVKQSSKVIWQGQNQSRTRPRRSLSK